MANNENLLDGMEEVIQEFLAESVEGLDQMDNDLVALEADPGDPDLLANIFRTIHSIKGTCGFFGYAKLESVSHVGESLLSQLRDGELVLTQEIATVLLNLVDAIREMLTAIESTGTDGENKYVDLVATLGRLKDGASATPGPPASKSKKASNHAKTTRKNKSSDTEAATAEDEQAPSVKPQRTGKDSPKPDATSGEQPNQSTRGVVSVAESAIRVDVDILDNLMNLVGELVLARNQILASPVTQEDPLLTNACQRLNLITSELQQDVMKTRMQPINTIWNKFPRVVRDIAKAYGKQAKVEMEGKETELDKSLIEAMKDPLTHLIRNAVDHGIETPDERVANGKPAEGRVALTAYHASGQVIIEIADDGAGINVARIREKAIELGLITSTQASQMSERDITRLIFAPGMTTSKKVTNISGRGVGMDVVRTNLEKIGGFIELDSTPGRGSSFRIQLPLTLAIIPALLVRSGNESFAIPQGSILELIRINQDDSSSSIEMIHGVPVFRLRGKLLPLVYLNRELELGDTRQPDGMLNIVVLQVDQRKFGLVVEAVDDSTEIVVKPLSEILKAIPVYAGATITGNGKVALILDVLGLAQRAKLLSESQDRYMDANAESTTHGGEADRRPFIIANTTDGGHIAIPVDSVVRLEEFKRGCLEQAGSRTVVQYGGKILPLINLAELLQERRRKPRKIVGQDTKTANDVVHAIVYSVDGYSVGLIVDRIQDIVDHSQTMQGPPTRKGTLGTIVIQERITEVFDVGSLQREICSMHKTPQRAAGG